MEIWLRHPVHGVKCASMEAEAATDRLNGWQDCPPYGRDPVNAVLQADELPVESEHAPLVAPVKRGPGRPRKSI